MHWTTIGCVRCVIVTFSPWGNTYNKDPEPRWLADNELSSKESTDNLVSHFTSLFSPHSLKSLGKNNPFLPSAIDLSIWARLCYKLIV